MRDDFNPKWEYCKCGQVFKPKLYHKVFILIFGKYTWNCPHCYHQIELKMCYHIFVNKRKDFKDDKIWRRG